MMKRPRRRGRQGCPPSTVLEASIRKLFRHRHRYTDTHLRAGGGHAWTKRNRPILGRASAHGPPCPIIVI